MGSIISECPGDFIGIGDRPAKPVGNARKFTIETQSDLAVEEARRRAYEAGASVARDYRSRSLQIFKEFREPLEDMDDVSRKAEVKFV